MIAFQIEQIAEVRPYHNSLKSVDIPCPEPKANEVLIRVDYCGVCHTELDEIEGRALPPNLPVIPGHQVVGEVIACGRGAKPSLLGARVGVAWIGECCGQCSFCLHQHENLCPDYQATGKDLNGGYAEYMCANAEFVVQIPEGIKSEHAAPLLCAGAIGYRSLSLCELQNGEALGLTGFGSSGKIALALARLLYPKSPIFVFARSEEERNLALKAGASWSGDTSDQPPQPLDAVIDTTPVWTPIVKALEFLAPNGRLVVNAISKLDVDQQVLLDLNFKQHLWQEKSLKSVANVTREDVRACLQHIALSDWRPTIEIYPFEQANQALIDLKFNPVVAAKVLKLPEH